MRYGHIKLSRKLFDVDPWWGQKRKFSRFEAWVDMLQLAAWRAVSSSYRGEEFRLERGEFVLSVRLAAKRWGWTEKVTRTFLKKAQEMAHIKAQREEHAGTVYLIVNYDAYQRSPDADDAEKGTPKGTPKGTQRAQRGHSKGTARAQEEAVKQGSREAVPFGASEDAPAKKENWVSELGDWWVEHIGTVNYGQLGNHAKSHHFKRGDDAIKRAALRYFGPAGKTGYRSAADFFATFAQWDKAPDAPTLTLAPNQPEAPSDRLRRMGAL